MAARAGESHTEILNGELATTVLVRGARLRVLDGVDAGRVLRTRSGHVVIGSHESADLVLRDRSVSRFHCEVRISPDRTIVRDLGSKNGTRIDDVEITEAPLRDRAVLTLGRTQVRFELGRERREPLPPLTRFGEMRGRSPAMRAAFALLDRAARSDTTVLLYGETGTGKDLAAASIHAAGDRRRGPFVVVDCGAIPGSLLEAELFGHERGAYTGADRQRAGAFEAAHGGTLFLDEIGELALDLQPKLLRALETREIRRLGGNALVPVDVRLVAATNQDLRVLVNQQRFRPDLFYRLAVIEVTLPALRERREDLPELVETLLAGFPPAGARMMRLFRGAEFADELRAHAWPGNVRELRNHLERCLLLEGRAPLARASAGAGPEARVGEETLRQARERWLGALERRYLEEILARHGNNVSAAARAAGVGRAYFYELLGRRGIR